MKQLGTVKCAHKLSNTTHTNELAFAQSETHFCKAENVFRAHILNIGISNLIIAQVAPTLIFIALKARSVYALIVRRMSIMASALAATFLITGIKPPECALFVQKLMNLM
jgi:hypothetical protein